MELKENKKIVHTIAAVPGEYITIYEEIKCKTFGTIKITYEFIREEKINEICENAKTANITQNTY